MAVEKKITPYRKNGAKVFTGRDKGVLAREELGLDKEEDKNEVITILIPSDTWNVNPSFFGGLFESSIKKYGMDFLQHYTFIYSNHTELNDTLKKNIDSNIDYVMRKLDRGDAK